MKNMEGMFRIYICHDNRLNRDYLPQIIANLQDREYELISLDEALDDDIYKQEDKYYRKWGISWFYRWMETQAERLKWMRIEPGMKEIEQLFNRLTSK